MSRPTRPLAARRVLLGYTQESLAEALRVDRSTVSRWERGEQLPQPWQRRHIARALAVNLEQLDALLTSGGLRARADARPEALAGRPLR